MKKLKKEYFTFIFASFMSLFMSSVISFCITLKNLGFSEDLLPKFISAWQIAFPMAFVIAQCITPFVKKITQKLVET